MTTDNGKSMTALSLMSLLLLIVLSPTYSAYSSGSGEEWETAFTVGKFLNSKPSKPDQIFKVQYRAINGTIEEFNMRSAGVIEAKVTTRDNIGNSLLEVRLPRNYPYTNEPNPSPAVLSAHFVTNERGHLAGAEHHVELTDCFFVFSIPFNASNNEILLFSGYLPSADFPHHGDSVPDSCVPQTVVADVPVKKDGTISPLKQIKAGVAPQDVVCPDEQHMLLISPQEKPYCASESTVTKLHKLWQEISGISCKETALYSRWECSSVAADDAARITVTVDVGGNPQQSSVQSGAGGSLMTMYLPVNMTQTIILHGPTENVTLYPIFADWDGIVRGDRKSLIVDENNEPVSFSGFGTVALHGVNATCAEPYFIKVDNSIGEDGGVQFENTTAPVSSIIYWGDTVDGSFGEPQSGIINYTQAGYGIVPAGYNDNNDDTYRNNGAGNQEVSGTYHLSFTSFYPATVNLPEQAEMTSSLELTCTNNADSPHIPKSEFPHIFVYDVWFRIE